MKHAFTLIELLCVMAIICLLLGMYLTQAYAFKSSLALNCSASQVAASLRVLQAKAMSQHQNYTFNADNLVLSSGIVYKKSPGITFSSSGCPTVGGSGTIILSNQMNKTKSIIVSSSGRVRVE